MTEQDIVIVAGARAMSHTTTDEGTRHPRAMRLSGQAHLARIRSRRLGARDSIGPPRCGEDTAKKSWVMCGVEKSDVGLGHLTENSGPSDAGVCLFARCNSWVYGKGCWNLDLGGREINSSAWRGNGDI